MKILILFLTIMLVGCASPNVKIETKEVLVPVWTPPVVNVPSRPILIDPQTAKSDGEIVRTFGVNSITIQQYAAELETIIYSLLKEKK